MSKAILIEIIIIRTKYTMKKEYQFQKSIELFFRFIEFTFSDHFMLLKIS